MTSEISNNVKQVWNMLDNAMAEISIQELCRHLTMTFEEVMTAVRWISKEHHVGMIHKDGHLMLSI